MRRYGRYDMDADPVDEYATVNVQYATVSPMKADDPYYGTSGANTAAGYVDPYAADFGTSGLNNAGGGSGSNTTPLIIGGIALALAWLALR